MRADASTLVVVQREWDGWRTAQVRFGDLEDIHWFQPTRAPRPLIHAYVSCSSVISGEISHGCRETPPPHRVLICVLKTHTAPWIYAELATRADRRALNNGAPAGGPRFGPPGRSVTNQLNLPRGNA
jgi:hypothetical protein